MSAKERQSKFVRVTSEHPCPICGHDSWCTVSERIVRCMRAESSRASNGSDGSIGWIHELGSEVVIPIRQEREVKPIETKRVTAIARSAYEHKLAPDTREKLATQLGVSVQALEALRVGYGCDRSGAEWSSWPSRDAQGRIVGISRRYEDGSKKTMQGTKCGLFYAADRSQLRGPILIVEGGSDVAAAFSVGLPAIGRPSNTGGVPWLKAMLYRRRKIVIGENDENPERRGKLQACPIDCQGCLVCWPGLCGAKIVASKLNCQYVMPPDGVKDFREAIGKCCWWELIRSCR